MREERGSWYLLTGLLIGVALGLLYAWVFAPVEYVDTAPNTLRADHKDTYRQMIALAYQSTGDLARAQARLALLADPDAAAALAEQAQRSRAAGAPAEEVQALAALAAALGQAPIPLPTTVAPLETLPPSETATITPQPTASDTPTSTLTPTAAHTLTPTATFTPTPGPTQTATRTPPPSPTPRPTNTPLPSRTPTPTLAPPFVLDRQVQVCNPALDEAQIQVFINNAAGQGVPGVEIFLTWGGGQARFFTGLKPEIDLGYADVTMRPGVIYTLQVASGGQLITDLSIPECEDTEGQRYAGSWRLIFKHP